METLAVEMNARGVLCATRGDEESIRRSTLTISHKAKADGA